jgi:hypothetical protein
MLKADPKTQEYRHGEMEHAWFMQVHRGRLVGPLTAKVNLAVFT